MALKALVLPSYTSLYLKLSVRERGEASLDSEYLWMNRVKDVFC